MKQQEKTLVFKRLKIVMISLMILLIWNVGGLDARMIPLPFFAATEINAAVPDERIGDSASGSAGTDKTAQAKVLALYQGKPEDNQKFNVQNMLPGDLESRNFCVQVYHDKDIELFFKVDLTEQTKALGEVLHIKVTHEETGKVLCDAPFNEINGKVFSRLLKAKGKKTTTANYQIDVSLDTSVGNEYQVALLRADFEWFVKDDGGLIVPPENGDDTTTPSKPGDHTTTPSKPGDNTTVPSKPGGHMTVPSKNGDYRIILPKTGDNTNLALWIALAGSSLVLIVLLWKRRKKDGQHKTEKKLIVSMITIVILVICLCITTFALSYFAVEREDNLFQTGEIKINLNDGKPVITEREYLFEPGMTVEKPFFIENQGTWDVYYKLYFDNVKNGLADVLDVKIRDGNTVLFEGKLTDLTKEQVGAADDVLKFKERRELTISFHFPEETGNRAQNQYLSFDLKADAVQTKNNPKKQFS